MATRSIFDNRFLQQVAAGMVVAVVAAFLIPAIQRRIEERRRLTFQ